MSLGGALQIGRSGLLANQAAIEVTGHNLANVATRGYHRQTIQLTPVRDQQVQNGVFIGRGVQLATIMRQVDQALESRLRGSIADEAGTGVRVDVLAEIEAMHNELSGNDLSTYLGEFFNAWSELANSPNDNSVRTVLTRQAQTVSSFIRNLRSELGNLQVRVDRDIDAAAKSADDLLTRIEQLNGLITKAEGGSGGAHALRDQRDILLAELSQYMDISVVESPSGAVDVFVGSLPVILDGRSRGLDVRRQTIDGVLQIDVVLRADGSVLQAESGRIGALVAARRDDVLGAIGALDSFANQLIYQVNRVHSQGQGLTGFGSVTGTSKVADTSAVLNSADAGLDFTPTHGSFQVHITQKSTGQRSTSTISVDLDGIDPANDTSLASLVADLNGVGSLVASITSDGRLKLNATTSDFEISFGDDSSGVLAALGINTFFQGSDSSDIDLNALVAASPGRVAAAWGHVEGDNRTALAIAGLRNRSLGELGGQSLTELWARHVEDFAVRMGQAGQQLDANSVVRANLEAQQQSVGGVNTDEEAINLLAYQRAYQGSARFLSVVDEMLQTLLGLL